MPASGGGGVGGVGGDVNVDGGWGSSPAATSTASSSSSSEHHQNPRSNAWGNPNPPTNPMQSWWESISLARSRIHALADLLPSSAAAALSALADSDLPARALLDSPASRDAVSAALSSASSGRGDDPLCQWLYDTFLSPDPDLRLVSISFLPLLSGIYLSRVIASGGHALLAGFEAVLLAVYSAEARARGGRPILVSIPDLSVRSLYHTPPRKPNPAPITPASSNHKSKAAPARPPSPPPPPGQPSLGVLSPPLEPQMMVKSTKRAFIVAAALDVYFQKIASMPSRSKVDLCEFVAAWAGQDCSCRHELDEDRLGSSSSCASLPPTHNIENGNGDGLGNLNEKMGGLVVHEGINGHHNRLEDKDGDESLHKGSSIPLPWELLQPVLRILGHCLLSPMNTGEVRDAASAAVRSVYARASHELMPQAILASRSLIQLDKRARLAAAMAAASNTITPSRPNKP